VTCGTDSIELISKRHVAKLLLLLYREINQCRWWRARRWKTLHDKHST